MDKEPLIVNGYPNYNVIVHNLKIYNEKPLLDAWLFPLTKKHQTNLILRLHYEKEYDTLTKLSKMYDWINYTHPRTIRINPTLVELFKNNNPDEFQKELRRGTEGPNIEGFFLLLSYDNKGDNRKSKMAIPYLMSIPKLGNRLREAVMENPSVTLEDINKLISGYVEEMESEFKL